MLRSDLCSRRPHGGGMGNGYLNCNSCSCVLRLACGGLVTDKNISSCEVLPALLVITIVMLPLQHLVNTAMSSSTVLLPCMSFSSTEPCHHSQGGYTPVQ